MKKIIYKLLALIEKIKVFSASSYWRFLIPEAPKDLKVSGHIIVSPPYNLRVGNNVVINEGVYINSRTNVIIGNNAHISSFVKINTGFLTKTIDNRVHEALPVIIGNNVWLGTGVIVNPGVIIGDNCIVGAGAVVTRDLPKNTLCVGVPAKPIKEL